MDKVFEWAGEWRGCWMKGAQHGLADNTGSKMRMKFFDPQPAAAAKAVAAPTWAFAACAIVGTLGI